MYSRAIVSALATSLALSVSAVPNPLPNPPKEKIFRNPLDRRQTTTTPADSPYATYGRLNPTYSKDQLNEIRLAYTEVDKLKYILSLGNSDDYFKFDFTPEGFVSNAGNGLGGQGYLAQATNFPVLLNTGLSMAIGYLNPCGLDSFHIHNRATEIVLLVAGKSLHTGFVLEDGFDQPVLTTIGLYQGTIRPQGSIHYEFNDNCEPAVFVAALSSEDPGVSRTSQNLFVEDPELVKAGLGYPDFLNNVNVTQFYGSIPAAFAQGAKACYERCGLKWNGTTHS